LQERPTISAQNHPVSLSGPKKSVNLFRIQRGEFASSRFKPAAKSSHKGQLVFRWILPVALFQQQGSQPFNMSSEQVAVQPLN